MADNFSPEGALWRRWDLHLHAPGTKLGNAYGNGDAETWNRYIEYLENSPVQVFGITDYFSADSYFEAKKRYTETFPDSVKVLFLNIEFRLSETISKDGSHPDIHVIFDNNEDVVNHDKVKRFLTNLETQTIDDASAKLRCIDLKSKADFEAATVSLDCLEGALKETFGDEKPYLIVFPANNDGLRSTDTNSPRKVSLADRIDRSCNVFFGNNGNRDFLLRKDRYSVGVSDPKPVVSGSDAHSFEELERLSGDVAGFPPTWIKADTTFVGLKQICHEPESRIFIGIEPLVLLRQKEDGTKFLDRVQIYQLEGYDEKNGSWFKDVDISLNPELTAIIGNKGSGKSAIVDILGLLGDSRQEDYFSFLTDDSKSKKFRRKGFAENFVGKITWHTGKVSEKRLSESCNRDKPEAVEYLPQNYFEQLTNDIEIEQFRKEIEDVVFSHVEETERLGKSSFSELEEVKTQQSKEEISSLKRQLRELNFSIVELEKENSTQFRSKISAQIETKKEEVKALDASKPKEVAKPDVKTPEQKLLVSKIDGLSEVLVKVADAGKAKVAEVADLKKQMQTAVSLKERLTVLESQTHEGIKELHSSIEELGLNVSDIFKFAVNFDALDERIESVKSKIKSIEADNELSYSIDADFDAYSTIPDLRGAYNFVQANINELKEKLSAPQRRFQEYIERLNRWTTKRESLVGSEMDPKPDTLNWLEGRVKYLDETLAKKLSDHYSKRKNIVESIYTSKSKFLQFYRDLKSSVEVRLGAVRTDEFEIEIESSFVINKDFSREFLNQINQRNRGAFRNTQEAEQYLRNRIGDTNWDNFDAIYSFSETILEKMNEDGCLVADQAHDVKGLYDYLFSLDYLSSQYQLRLGGKDLNELSPGEKGLLLLIFYLQLDRKTTPLIIDQPEDNLDNESIFTVLANCIRAAKNHRQIILVTHNPNLAVGADAEQIIYVKLDKADNYKFSYENGAIENPEINQRIVDVLEGSQPAFVKRRLKYGIR